MLDRKAGEHVDLLFAMRARRVAKTYINATIIPSLCRKAGVPAADARGSITSHRARSTIANSSASWPTPRRRQGPTPRHLEHHAAGPPLLQILRTSGASLRQRQGRLPGPALEVVPSPADRVAGHPEHREDRADNDHDDADGPDDGDFGDEADNEQDHAENYHRDSW
jgi:hypothetical protein